MQEVSSAWKDAQQQTLVPESYVEIILNVGDPDAQENAEATSNGEENFSNVSSVVSQIDNNPVMYATLEENIWGLNNAFSILPDKAPYGENGYVGNALCNSNCEFHTDAIPTITISFSQTFTAVIPGITITWATAYGEYADTFRITVYNGNNQIYQKTISGNTDMETQLTDDIQNYNKIVVEILKWCLPYKRARVDKILVGIEKIYQKSEIMNFVHTMFVDPLTAELPKTEITFKIKNLNGEYNPDNPKGTEKYLMERQQITARYGYKLNDAVEWIPAGVFYMSKWETPQNGITATFTARDGIELMSDLYTGPNTGTLMTIITSAFTQSGLPQMPDGTNRWIIETSLNSISAPDNIDLSKYSIAEVIQLCANAACCVFYQDREGVFHVEPILPGNTDYEINQFNSHVNSEISLTKQLKAVDINDGSYILNVGDIGETQQVSNPLISPDRAQTVARWIANYLGNRRELSGEFRADPRLDALDRVTNTNQFAETTVLVTQIRYSYNGAFRGNYEGRSGV